jgi:hypothetical protein
MSIFLERNRGKYSGECKFCKRCGEALNIELSIVTVQTIPHQEV